MENTHGEKVVRVKKPFMMGAALLLAAVGLQATPVSPCPVAPTNYADLVSTEPCTLGSIVYSDFIYGSTAVNGTAVPEDQVSILEESANTLNGFLFSLPMSAAAGQTEDVTLGYTVTDTTPGTLITSVDIPFWAGSAKNGGTASIDETVIGPNGVLGMVDVGPGTPSAKLTFSGVTSLTIVKDLVVNGGINGSATISVLPDYINLDSAPEPGFYGVLAAGVAGIFMFARRHKKSV
jgi:hypothetical protein